MEPSSLFAINYPLSDLVFYRAGGTAAYVAFPTTEKELLDVLDVWSKIGIPLVVIGHGSNTLFADGHHNIFVICMRDYDATVLHNPKESTMYAGAGVLLDTVVGQSVFLGYSQLCPMSGIPGGVGGAAKMNAGAFGSEMKDTTIAVRIMDIELRKSGVMEVDENTFGYRSSEFGNNIILLGVWFKFNEPSDMGGLVAQRLQNQRKEILSQRDAKQPLQHPSCGSVFKRPEGNYAGKLISDAELKGFEINGAQVSTKHANFILNTGNASATDIHNVINHVQRTVFEMSGVMLEPEVQLIGFD